MIKLRKGENVNLSQQFAGQTQYRVGLSWDLQDGKTFDLDAIAIELTDKLSNGGKAVSENHIAAYFNANADNKSDLTFAQPGGVVGFKSTDDCLKHLGDNRTGAGDGDDETIQIDLSKASGQCKSILILANIYDIEGKGFNFGMVKNAMIKLYTGTSDVPELAFELQEDFSGSHCLEFAEIYLRNNEWKMSALGDANNNSLEDELKKLGIPCE